MNKTEFHVNAALLGELRELVTELEGAELSKATTNRASIALLALSGVNANPSQGNGSCVGHHGLRRWANDLGSTIKSITLANCGSEKGEDGPYIAGRAEVDNLIAIRESVILALD